MAYRATFQRWTLAIATALPMALLPFFSSAQTVIENVIVETYYVADANDATDTIGGGVPEGSRTYRVYIDLAPGYALRAIYGREGHPVLFSSTAPFFNHLDRGRTFGHEINNNALDEGTVALDSWLALGGASNQRRGVLKTLDPDGSIVGGSNSDGGSEEIPGGLLANTAPELGIPLTEQDGLHPVEPGPVLPPNFLAFGAGLDSAFRDSTLVSSFLSSDFRMGCSTPGVQGPTAENQILVAQLTTLGDLTFELNIEVEQADGTLLRFVARDTLLEAGETANGLLSFPPQCGCMDPNFLEFDPTAGCDDGSCQTTIIFGCLDATACNYDPDANFDVPQLCCYGPTECNGLDVTVVCPGVSVEELYDGNERIIVFPNPVEDGTLRISAPAGQMTEVLVHDMSGRMVASPELLHQDGSTAIQVAALSPGMYHLTLTTRSGVVARRFVIK